MICRPCFFTSRVTSSSPFLDGIRLQQSKRFTSTVSPFRDDPNGNSLPTPRMVDVPAVEVTRQVVGSVVTDDCGNGLVGNNLLWSDGNYTTGSLCSWVGWYHPGSFTYKFIANRVVESVSFYLSSHYAYRAESYVNGWWSCPFRLAASLDGSTFTQIFSEGDAIGNCNRLITYQINPPQTWRYIQIFNDAAGTSNIAELWINGYPILDPSVTVTPTPSWTPTQTVVPTCVPFGTATPTGTPNAGCTVTPTSTVTNTPQPTFTLQATATSRWRRRVNGDQRANGDYTANGDHTADLDHATHIHANLDSDEHADSNEYADPRPQQQRRIPRRFFST